MEHSLDRVSEITRNTQETNDAMRQHWNRTVLQELRSPSHYQSVAVLLIQWANWLDPDLQHYEEVCTLRYLVNELLKMS